MNSVVSISQVYRVEGVPRGHAGVVCVAEMVLGGARPSSRTLVGGVRALIRA